MKNDNIKYIFLDVWETLLISNNNDEKINYERAKILCDVTRHNNIEYWKETIKQEIYKFKEREKNGITVTPKERIKKIVKEFCIDNSQINKIIDQYDSLIIKKYKPSINNELINILNQNDGKIILVSNTGLTTKKAIIQILKENNILDLFLDMFFSEDYQYCKPNTEFYNVIMKKYKISSKEVIMYGDSKIMDWEPCNKLGIKCIVKNWRKLYYEHK